MKPRFCQYEYPRGVYAREVATHTHSVGEYDRDIYDTMMAQIAANRPNVELYRQQPYLTPAIRSKLVDFLLKMAVRLKIVPFVFAKAVRLFDRYCSKRIVLLDQSQLIITTCLWIAAKTQGGNNHFVNLANLDKVPSVRTISDLGYGAGGKFIGPTERFRLPKLHELVKLCGAKCNYDAGMFKQMEVHVLSTLEWATNDPGVDEFLMSSAEFCTIPSVVHSDGHHGHPLSLGEMASTKRFLAYVAHYSFDLCDVHPVHLAHVIGDIVNDTFNLTPGHPSFQSVGPILELGAPLDYTTYKSIKKHVVKSVLASSEFILKLFASKGPQYLYHQVCLAYKFGASHESPLATAVVAPRRPLGVTNAVAATGAGAATNGHRRPSAVSPVGMAAAAPASPLERKKPYPYTPSPYQAYPHSSQASVSSVSSSSASASASMSSSMSPMFAAPHYRASSSPQRRAPSVTTTSHSSRQQHQQHQQQQQQQQQLYKLPSLPHNGIFVHSHQHLSQTSLTSSASSAYGDDATGADLFEYDYVRRQGISTPLSENDSPIFIKH
ncbi:hypothetical protein DIURU_001760 [Diutina rugosa]|uniref:Cyclin-like domain-containing protein n=1 Tax=Diutina rugosa TaxID=5481 RepID=A0A642UT88_DIURU|nr:uncharacterized protein DIURU_001760 [Diutina rugosa]KAA8904924.1 hypothetical protein DIURU_001760 [Diutina rugosa]